MEKQQDPRVLRTRQLIRESFIELLQSIPFESITIKDIAQKATINRATFYTHYEDKYALLDEVIEQAFKEMIPEQVIHAQAFTEEIGDQIILLTYRYIVDFHQTCRLDSKSIATLVDSQIKGMLQKTIENILSKEKENHQYIEILAAITSAAIYSATYEWFRLEKNSHADLLLDIVRPYIMRGLSKQL